MSRCGLVLGLLGFLVIAVQLRNVWRERQVTLSLVSVCLSLSSPSLVVSGISEHGLAEPELTEGGFGRRRMPCTGASAERWSISTVLGGSLQVSGASAS